MLELDFDLLAIYMDPHTRRVARAVVGDRYVLPLLHE